MKINKNCHEITIVGKLLGLVILSLVAIAAMADGPMTQVGQLDHFRDCDGCSEMVVLPSGKYMMGATKAEFEGQDKYSYMYIDETPRHEEPINSFAIAKFNVTRKQFAIFARETGFQGKGCEIFNGKAWITDASAGWQNPGFRQTDNDPVVCVSWDDAQKYIGWLNSKLHKTTETAYRLPTEAEWEYAARAGTVTAAYWRNNPQDQCKYENARDESARFLDPAADHASCTDGYIYTAPVGTFKPNPWGLYDMLGNAEQWVEDCVMVGYGGPPNLSSAQDSCKSRALRGTSWAGIPFAVRSASRAGMAVSTRESNYGFRLARSIQP
jgi:formylglycine-generating enzyme required for sulfatase activity